MKQEIIRWTSKISAEAAKHSPAILSGIAVIGVAAVAVEATRATLKAERKLERIKQREEEGAEPFTFKEKAMNIAPLYFPTAIIFVTTAVCIIGSQTINTKRQLALASAYSLSTEAMKELESKVKEEYGEKKIEKLKDEINGEKGRQIYIQKQDGIINTGYGDQVFIDLTSGQVFKSDMEHVKRSYLDLKECVAQGEQQTLNALYRSWGIREVKFGDEMIWDINITGPVEWKLTTDWIDPETKEIACTCIDFYSDPILRREY